MLSQINSNTQANEVKSFLSRMEHELSNKPSNKPAASAAATNKQWCNYVILDKSFQSLDSRYIVRCGVLPDEFALVFL